MADDGADTPLGTFIRKQRELQALSMRQLANLAGISNPYLSQIERGLREPSEKVLEALATNLELSADALYEQAGRTRRPAASEDGAADADEAGESAVESAIKADPRLSARQRAALLEVYAAFTISRRGRRR
jgi:transcriptional regulator with XRE-family HTH domain